MLTYAYGDAYLAPHITEDRETRAIADVALAGTFPTAWTERLVRLRAYIIACQELTKSAEDVFAVKLGAYRSEYRDALPQARAAQDATTSDTGTGSIFSIPLERA